MSHIESGTILKMHCPDKLVWHHVIISTFGIVKDRAKKGVQSQSSEEFSENLHVEMVPHDPNDFTKYIIHQRAMGRGGQRGYYMIFQNCERFVSWCRKNNLSSPRLNNAVIGLVAFVLIVAIVVRIIQ